MTTKAPPSSPHDPPVQFGHGMAIKPAASTVANCHAPWRKVGKQTPGCIGCQTCSTVHDARVSTGVGAVSGCSAACTLDSCSSDLQNCKVFTQGKQLFIEACEVFLVQPDISIHVRGQLSDFRRHVFTSSISSCISKGVAKDITNIQVSVRSGPFGVPSHPLTLCMP